MELQDAPALRLQNGLLGAFVTHKLRDLPQSTTARTTLLLNVHTSFLNTFLASRGIHSLAAAFDADVHKTDTVHKTSRFRLLRWSRYTGGGRQ
ncbi:hypothetical protein PLICRDRAFT_40451 [Plicaturopsis crispa FD-325 SS-3]|nr:hypothetical protein PLICRDRAFT_40451 [Plicaturopsis crispa FD-325 SS-3]